MFQKFFIIIAMLVLCNAPALQAQKALKTLKSALKDKKYAESVKTIETLRKDSVWKDSPKLAIYAIDAYKGLNDAENLKLYLKKSYDTIAFFSTTKQIIDECILLDSLEKAKSKEKYKRRKLITENIHKYFSNIPPAARFLYKRGKFTDALPYLEMSLGLPGTELGKDAHITVKSKQNLAALHVTCSFNAKEYGRMMRFAELALSDTASRPYILHCLALKSEAIGDTANYRKWLEQGLREYGRQTFFFIHLADYHLKAKNFKEVERMSKLRISTDSTCKAAWLALCNATFHLEDYERCIESAQKLSLCDSTNAEAYYYEGASYAALAAQVPIPDNINSTAYRKATQNRRSYALKAEPALEKYRSMTPESQKVWAPLLYQTYLILNRGKKFEEIDTLLHGVKAQWPTR